MVCNTLDRGGRVGRTDGRSPRNTPNEAKHPMSLADETSTPDSNDSNQFGMIEMDPPPVAPKAKAPIALVPPAPIAAPMLTLALAVAAIIACVTSEALKALGLTFKGRILPADRDAVRARFATHMDTLKAREAAVRASWVGETPSSSLEDSQAHAATAPVAAVDRNLAESLAAVTAHATSNASGTTLQQNAGYNTIAGFSTAEGYIEGARKAVTAATRREWLDRAKAMGVTVDESTLPPLPVMTALPVGKGIVHMPTGPSVFDVPRSQRKVFAATASATVSVVRPTLGKGDLIAGAIAAGQGVLISWAGSGKIERKALMTALAAIDCAEIAPAAKSARAQAGRAALALNGAGFVCRTVAKPKANTNTGAEMWPADVSHRWIAGVVDATSATESLGSRALTVDLLDSGLLRFDGNALLAARVRSDYEARCAGDVYTSADLTAWLQRVLREEHHAVAYGVTHYVPAGEAPAAKALVKAVSALWGTQWMRGLPVASESELISGLTEGLAQEIAEIGERFEAAKVEAKEANRVQVGARRATTLLADLGKASERVTGYALMLGDDSVSAIRASIALLDGAIRPLCDDSSQRAAMLDMD